MWEGVPRGQEHELFVKVHIAFTSLVCLTGGHNHWYDLATEIFGPQIWLLGSEI